MKGQTMDETWFYLSYVGEGGFVGAINVQAPDFERAVFRAEALGAPAHCEIKGMGPLPGALVKANVPERDRERMLTREELEGQGPTSQWTD